MLSFIKKLFGFDEKTLKDAGVQIEQAPYKVPEPAAITPIPAIPETVAQPSQAAKPAAMTAPKKAPAKQPVHNKQGKKAAPAKSATSKPRGRKPKAKAQ